MGIKIIINVQNYNLCTLRKLYINRHCSYDHVTCIDLNQGMNEIENRKPDSMQNYFLSLSDVKVINFISCLSISLLPWFVKTTDMTRALSLLMLTASYLWQGTYTCIQPSCSNN